jgi:ABC-type Fe3+ transport system substrate-binding protein
VDKLDARYRDKKAAPTWTGLWGFAAAVCFNTVEAAKRNIPKPASWADLTKPVYKGQITMPNPASSGTGFLSDRGLGADHGQGQGLELHGRAARQHRRLLAQRLQALQPGGRPANTWSASRCPAARPT